MTFQEQIKHPLWQKKRLEVLEAKQFTCEQCGDTESTLHVHHTTYIKNRKLWEYDITELRCFCENCHNEFHSRYEQIKKLSNWISIDDMTEVIGFLETLKIKDFYIHSNIPPENNKILKLQTNGSFEYCCGVSHNFPFLNENDVITLAKKNNGILIYLELERLNNKKYEEQRGEK